MDYLSIYNKLIKNAKTRTETFDYVEKHHIQPKCLGGSDHPENIVQLTGREHFIAHQLLYKIYKDPKLAHANNMMCMNLLGKRMTNRRYDWVRKRHAEAVRENMMGVKNHRYGTHLTETAKKNISEFHVGKIQSLETREKISKSLAGKYCGKNSKNFGKKREKDSVISSSSQCKIPVFQLDMKTGEIIKEYPSASDAARELGGHDTLINKVISGERKQTLGFGWMKAPIKLSDIKVAQLDKNTEEFIKLFDSVAEAVAHIGYKNGRELKRVISGKRGKTYAGFKWKYIKNEKDSY